MALLVTAGYVTVPTAVDGGIAHIDIYRGSVLPADVPDEHVQALLSAGHLVDVSESEPQAEPESAPVRKRAAKAASK